MIKNKEVVGTRAEIKESKLSWPVTLKLDLCEQSLWQIW